jgi:hypothetical protein
VLRPRREWRSAVEGSAPPRERNPVGCARRPRARASESRFGSRLRAAASGRAPLCYGTRIGARTTRNPTALTVLPGLKSTRNAERQTYESWPQLPPRTTRSGPPVTNGSVADPGE